MHSSRRALIGCAAGCACMRCLSIGRGLGPRLLERTPAYSKFQADAMCSEAMSVQYENAVSPVKARFIPPALDGCGSMCDVGIGAAPNLQYISPSEQLHVIGVDSNPVMLERASARIAPAQLQLDCRQGDIDNSLPLSNASVDAVVCTLVLCSVASQHHALSEMTRVLKPSGRIVLIEHVRARSPLLSLAQTVLTPLQTLAAGNCHLDRPTDVNVQKEAISLPLQVERAEWFELSGFGPLSTQFACILSKTGDVSA